jgi:hypothetical protein
MQAILRPAPGLAASPRCAYRLEVAVEWGAFPGRLLGPKEPAAPMRAVTSLVALAIVLAAAGAARAVEVTVPADVGVGPAFYVITGEVARDQPVHFGLKLSVQAIIDQATIRAHQDRIPPRYRQQALRLKEMRYSPSILIPDSLIISPAVGHTGIYGITWRPFSLGVPLVDTGSACLRLAAGLLVTYAYIHSDLEAIPETHFFRPGVDVGADLEVMFSSSFGVSLGWASGFYLPQVLGGFGLAEEGKSVSLGPGTLWHFGQAYLKLHVRFPYTARM